MWSFAACSCLFLAACQPVLLAGDESTGPRAPSGSSAGSVSDPPAQHAGDGGFGEADSTDSGPVPGQGGGAPPPPPPTSGDTDLDVQLAVKAAACGGCFDLVATGTGGTPPYHFEWEDGTQTPTRRVCAGAAVKEIWVVAKDAASGSSRAYVTRLQADAASAACADTTQPKICLMNPSFEGTPTVNTGQLFDAVPWSACRDPADTNDANTPDIVNTSIDPGIGVAPAPTEGATYLTLTTGEQASEALCDAVTGGSRRSLKLDLMRLDLGAGSDVIFLELWGGVAADCSQRQLLWASPVPQPQWNTYCVTLQPSEYMDQLTLRANTTNTMGLVVNYLAVDNLVPVDSCP